MRQDRRRSHARAAAQDPALHQLTLRVGLVLAVVVSLVAGLVRAAG